MNALLGPLVPIVAELPLLEVQTTEGLGFALDRMMSSELPGFVIRKAGLDGEREANTDAVAEAIIRQLGLLGHIFTKSVTDSDDFSIQQGFGTGKLHRDVYAGRVIEDLNLHTTTEGAGKVILAESPTGLDNSNPENWRLSASYEIELHEVLLEGKTDPRFMQPTLYVAHLTARDRILFPLANGNGPIWHRFDTSTPGRSALVKILERSTED